MLFSRFNVHCLSLACEHANIIITATQSEAEADGKVISFTVILCSSSLDQLTFYLSCSTKSGGITKDITIQLQGNMDNGAEFNGYPSNKCADISLKTKNLMVVLEEISGDHQRH